MPPTDAEASKAVSTSGAPKPNPRNNVAMFTIFQNVQFNVVQHKKYVKEMMKLYRKLDQEVFRESFKNALMYLFTFGDTSANVDRAIQFVASFCTALDDEEEFLQFICDIIFECQCVSGQSVRYRASQLLAAVLAALGEDASLDDDLCDKLLASQMQRLQDTRGAVRCRAALALQRLQNPPDDEVTRAYRFHMSCDPSSSVRRAVLMSIAKCKNNVPFVLERLCDVDEAVRRAAFLYMAAMPVTQLKLTQRVMTLKVGLAERSQRVRRVVEEILIPGWLSTFRGNIIDLLKAIRLDNAQDAKDSQYVAGKLLESLFKRLQVSELLEWLPTDKTLRVIPAEKLNKETAWYWRHLAEHLQRSNDDETLETVLPDLVILIGYIRAIMESPCPSQSEDSVGFSTRQNVLHELGSLLRVYDVTDPAGREALQTLVTDMLTGDYGPLNCDVIRAFVNALEMVIPVVAARMEVVMGAVSALLDPPEPEAEPQLQPPTLQDDTQLKMERARLRVSLNVAMEAQEEAVRDQNYALAAECKAKVEDIHKKLEELNAKQTPAPSPPPVVTAKERTVDADTINKCLTIINCALDTPQLTIIPPVMRLAFKELEVEIFHNPEVLENALQTVALFGMLDKEFLIENKAFFFTNLIDTSNEPAACTVLRCCVDLMCVHGARVFEEDIEDSRRTTRNDGSTMSESRISTSPSHSTVIELLLKIMDSECTAFRLIIVEGLCRLLHLGHLESPAILSRLLLLWFNPATVDEDMLRQTIGVFFQTYPMRVEGAQDQIQKATMPTLRTLANAPSSSPLAEIDHEAVVRFIVSLTRVNHEVADSQGAMALTVTQALTREPSGAEAGLACRLLALLSPPRDAHLATQLATTLRNVLQDLPDKQSARNLTRYLSTLEAAERASLNKMSHTGGAEGTLQPEDTLTMTGRATTSLPQPIARSTHVVINETVEEEPEIDETSPTDAANASTFCTAPPQTASTPEAKQTASTTEASHHSPGSDSAPGPENEVPSDSSGGVSPVKKVRVTKEKKKKLSITRRDSDTEKTQKQNKEDQESQDSEKGGVKRSRSQRSLVDVDSAKEIMAKGKSKKPPSVPSSEQPNQPKSPEIPRNIDLSNVTIRKSSKVVPSTSKETSAAKNKTKKGAAKEKNKKGAKTKVTTRVSDESIKSRSSASPYSPFDDSADETELHTIVYDNELEQSLLNESSSSELGDSKQVSKGNVTVPETPDASEESEPETEPEPVKNKGKKKQ